MLSMPSYISTGKEAACSAEAFMAREYFQPNPIEGRSGYISSL